MLTLRHFTVYYINKSISHAIFINQVFLSSLNYFDSRNTRQNSHNACYVVVFPRIIVISDSCYCLFFFLSLIITNQSSRDLIYK